MDDIQVVQEVLQGKTDHYSFLMDKYHNEIFSFVFNMVGQYQDTEDVVQEIFFKTYQSLSTYDSKKSSFRTWLYRIASNHTINYINSARYRYSAPQELDLSYIEDEQDIEKEIIKQEQMNQIISAMKRILSHKHQKILSLYYFSGLTVKDISNSYNIPEKTIYKALKSSIEKLKKEVTINE